MCHSLNSLSKCLVKQDVFLILRDGKPVPYGMTTD